MLRLRHPQVKFGSGGVVGGNCSFTAGAAVGSRVTLSGVALGRGATIRDRVQLLNVQCAEHVVINSDTVMDTATVGRFSYIGARGQLSRVEIGSFCSIGPELICGYGDHPADFVSTHPVFFSLGKQSGVTFARESLFAERKQIVVGHDVWIGARVFMRDGVKIGHGAIVAAGSVVIKDVPAYAIVGGVPAKVIKYRFSDEEIARLLALAWWNWDEARLRAAQPDIASNNVTAFLARYSTDGIAAK